MLDVPVYISLTGTGANATYTLKGFAAFVVTGYHLPGLTATDWVTGKARAAAARLLHQRLLHPGTRQHTGSLGGTNLGAAIIKLTG